MERTVPPTVSEWSTAIGAALADPSRLVMAYQPVVDLARGTVAGYEALARFAGPPQATPDVWFRAAGQLGVAAELEAAAIGQALDARHALPPDSFLSLNVSPLLLDEPPVREVLERSGPLDRVIVELTEHVPVEDYAPLGTAVERLRLAGASIAVDDAGAGYASLSHILALRPQFVKLDRAIVDGVDRDGGKLALVEMLGTFASRIDAWVIAEGVERPEELDALVRLGVPLAQGWLLARPAPAWVGVPAEVAVALQERAVARHHRASVAPLVERAGTAAPAEVDRAFGEDPSLDWVVLLDERGWPVGIHARGELLPRPAMRVQPGHGVADVARRAVARPAALRFDPLVCCDEQGVYQGVVRVERLVERLSDGGGAPAG
jgi:EAL domain-containing protein (putative c-di-GMP-specific phosphodiesterase class I)